MVRELYSKLVAVDADGTQRFYREIACEDGDTLPKEETCTGSKAIDVTNGTYSLFSETADDWLEQFSIQG